MKFIYDGEQVFELSENQIKVIKNDIPGSIFNADMLRRCKYWLESPVEKFVNAKKDEILRVAKERGVTSLPLDKMKCASKFCEIDPPKHGYADINKSIECSVGDEKFVLGMDCLKGWRKILQERQEELDIEEYKAEEEKLLKDRMKDIIQHKYERCLERLRSSWSTKLEERGIQNVPVDDDEFCNLVFSQIDYMDREARDEIERKSI